MFAPQRGPRTWCALGMLTLAGSGLLLLPAGTVRGQGNTAPTGGLFRSIEDMVDLLGQAVRHGNRQEVRLVDRALDDLIHAMEHRWAHHHHHHHGHFHKGMQQAAKHEHHENAQSPTGTGTGQSTGTTSNAGSGKTATGTTSATPPTTTALGDAMKTGATATIPSGHVATGNAGKSSSLAKGNANHNVATAHKTAAKSPKQPTPQLLAKTAHNAGAAVGQHKATSHLTAGKKK